METSKSVILLLRVQVIVAVLLFLKLRLSFNGMDGGVGMHYARIVGTGYPFNSAIKDAI